MIFRMHVLRNTSERPAGFRLQQKFRVDLKQSFRYEHLVKDRAISYQNSS